MGTCCIRSQAGLRGCVSYLPKTACRVGPEHGNQRYTSKVVTGHDVYGHLLSHAAYPFRAFPQQINSTHDPCVCDKDGIIGGIDTGRPGCHVHVTHVPAFCMVPLDCTSLDGVSSTFVGVGYRWCVPGELTADGTGVPLRWTAFTWFAANNWNASVTIVNASMWSDDGQPNRDADSFGNARTACPCSA